MEDDSRRLTIFDSPEYKEQIDKAINKLSNELYENIVKELVYAQECHKLEEELCCPLEEMVEFIKLLKTYYYVGIGGQLIARTIWDNTKLNEKELYKINHIFNNIKDKRCK